MDLNYNRASNIWDLIKDGKAVPLTPENDEGFPENILSPEQDNNHIEIMDFPDRSRGWEREGETEVRLRNDTDIPKHSIKCEKARTEDDQAVAENAILTAQNELNALLDQLEPRRLIPKELTAQTDQVSSLPSHVSDLITDTKHQLEGMKAFAAFAKNKFRDPELGIRYQKAFLRRIDKAMALLNSYADYLSLTHPARKTNTINSLIGKVLTKHAVQLEDQQLEIIRRQFAEDLPETKIPEAQLEYILDSLMQYITHSTSSHGNLGLLTRLVDDPKRTGEENDSLRTDRKYVEILFVFSTQDNKSDHPSSTPGRKSMELILCLVQEIIEKNKGFMEVKPAGKNAMAFISLKVPVERRTVLEFKALR